MTAAQLLVKCLENEGVEYIFGIPGEENIDVMDALLDSPIKFVTTHHACQCLIPLKATKSQLWNTQAATARHAGSSCGGRSASPWSFASNACRTRLGQVQAP